MLILATFTWMIFIPLSDPNNPNDGSHGLTLAGCDYPWTPWRIWATQSSAKIKIW